MSSYLVEFADGKKETVEGFHMACKTVNAPIGSQLHSADKGAWRITKDDALIATITLEKSTQTEMFYGQNPIGL